MMILELVLPVAFVSTAQGPGHCLCMPCRFLRICMTWNIKLNLSKIKGTGIYKETGLIYQELIEFQLLTCFIHLSIFTYFYRTAIFPYVMLYHDGVTRINVLYFNCSTIFSFKTYWHYRPQMYTSML